MCHQVIHIFECGHNDGSKTVRCKKPNRSSCGGVFLRQELENVTGLCAVRQPLSLPQTMLMRCSYAKEPKMPEISWKYKMRVIGLDGI